MAVVVERAKLGGELRDDRCDESGRQSGDQRRVDERVKSAVSGNAELAAGDGVRDEAADVERPCRQRRREGFA